MPGGHPYEAEMDERAEERKRQRRAQQRTQLSAANMAAFLNDALKTDPSAVGTLFQLRRSCGKGIHDHPYIVCGAASAAGPYTLSFLGLLNGMLLAAGSHEVLALEIDDANSQNVLGFKVVLFVPHTPSAAAGTP